MIVTVDATIEELSNANFDEIQFLFSEITRSSILGKHYISLSRDICDWATENLALGSKANAHLQLLKQEFTQRGAILGAARRILSVKLNVGGLQLVSNRIYEIGYRTLLRGHYLDEPIVLVENTANDGEFFKQVLNLHKHLNPTRHFSYDLRHGGGSTISECFSRELAAQRITVCIVDSDKQSPHVFLSGTVRQLNHIAEGNAYVGGVYPTPCREIENFLPLDLIEKHRLCPMYPDLQTIKDIIGRQQTMGNHGDECWLFFDLKEGLSGEALLAKDLPVDVSNWIQQHFTPDGSSFSQTTIAGFGPNLLRTFLNSNPAMRDFGDFTRTEFWAAVFAPLFEAVLWFLAADRKKAAL